MDEAFVDHAVKFLASSSRVVRPTTELAVTIKGSWGGRTAVVGVRIFQAFSIPSRGI